MKSNYIKFIFILAIVVLFAYGFSASLASERLDNIAYIICLGIDKGDNAKIKLSAQFTNVSGLLESSSSSESINVLYSSESDSLYGALNKLNSMISKELSLSHCEVVVFSEDFAKEGISTELYSLMNNEDLRSSAHLVVSSCSASEYIENSKPDFEKLITKYFDSFSLASKYTGSYSNITIGEFYNNMYSRTCDSIAIYGDLLEQEVKTTTSKTDGQSSDSSSSSNSGGNSGEGKSQDKTTLSENIGIAVFDEDVFRGKLSALETVCHLLIQNDLSSCVLSVPTEDSESKITDILVIPSKTTKINVKIKDQMPHISISTKLDADVLTIDKNSDYTNSDAYNKLSNSAEKYLKEEIIKYLNKTKEFGTDIDNFGSKALCNFLTTPEWKNFNWLEKYKDAEFDVNVDINVNSSLLITRT